MEQHEKVFYETLLGILEAYKLKREQEGLIPTVELLIEEVKEKLHHD